MPNVIKSNQTTKEIVQQVVTKDGEMKLDIHLHLDININANGGIHVDASNSTIEKKKNNIDEEEDVGWAIPDFGDGEIIQFGKEGE